MLLEDKAQSSYSCFALSNRCRLLFQVSESRAFIFMLEKIFLMHIFFVCFYSMCSASAANKSFAMFSIQKA